MGVNNNFPYPKKQIEQSQDWLRLIASIVENTVNGKTNNTGEVTLQASAASTVVDNILCNENSAVLIVPTTASAATENASGSVYVVAGDESFTIHHVNSVTADRVFKYIIVG